MEPKKITFEQVCRLLKDVYAVGTEEGCYYIQLNEQGDRLNLMTSDGNFGHVCFYPKRLNETVEVAGSSIWLTPDNAGGEAEQLTLLVAKVIEE